MFRKTVLSAVAIAVLSTSAMTVTAAPAAAANGKNGALIAGAILGGLAAVIGGSAAHANQNNGYGYQGHRRHDDFGGGYRHHQPRPVCFDKPIRRWNAYEGRKVVVGYKTICRDRY